LAKKTSFIHEARKINTGRMYYSGVPGCKLCCYLRR